MWVALSYLKHMLGFQVYQRQYSKSELRKIVKLQNVSHLKAEDKFSSFVKSL